MSINLRVPPHLKGDPKVEEKLRLLAELCRVNPLYAYNNPAISAKIHHKQLEFHAIKPGVMGTKALIAGNRAGKTVACTVDDVIQLIPRDEVPAHLVEFKKFEPPCHIWVGAPKQSKHDDTIIPLFRKWLPKSQLIDGNFDKSYNAQKKQIRLVCGSTIGLKTYDQDVDAWASAEIHRIRWDEEPNGANGKRMRGEARGRLVSTDGDEVIGMTPLLGISTWAFEDIWEKRFEPDIDVVTMTIHDNPWNTPEAIEKFLSGLTAEERRARETGEFVHFGGLFFDEFRDRLHVVEPPPIQKIRQQEIVVCIDPGLRHTGVTWTAFDSDNAAVCFAEYFPPKTVVPEIAAEIKRRNAEWKLPEPVYVIDPSYRNLTTDIHADAVQASYAREGIYVQPGNNDRRAGILEIKKRFQSKDGEGKPHPTLLLSKACPNLIKQVELYRRNPDSSNEWDAAPQTEASRFDLVDSLRYAVMSRAWEYPEERQIDRGYSYEYGVENAYDPNEFQIDAPPLGDSS